MFRLELSCHHMEQQGRATRAKVVLGARITAQPIGLPNFGIKSPRVVPTCFGLFYAAAHLDVLSVVVSICSDKQCQILTAAKC